MEMYVIESVRSMGRVRNEKLKNKKKKKKIH